MAQHDYDIINQTSSELRTDLNNALAAIVSQNSGDTEPSTPFSSQIWYDTLTNILKQRNESNSAWITLGTVNEGAGKFEPNQTFATQAEALARTLDTVAMTPLRTNDAIVNEDVYSVSGTTPALSVANGTIQTWTLSGNSTPTSSLTTGQSITLMVNDGTAYTITWPSVTWVNNAATAPTLATTGYTVVALWNVSGTLYGALVGNRT
jgi:hypothetical protein